MKVWIINHYAIPPSMGGLVRHYYFSKYLQKKGHKVQIFTASKIHNTDINMISGKELYKKERVDGITYTFIRTSDYKGNGIDRIVNILQFPLRIWKVYKKFEKPDVIYTSSPDLFTVFSAMLLAKFLHVPKVVEIRDLWPEAVVTYGRISEKNIIIKILRVLEKWIYKNADELIFTMRGCKKYLKEKGWEKEIDKSKIHYLNNGVDLYEYEYDRKHYRIEDIDLLDENSFKIVYTGSIRKANNLEFIVQCAMRMSRKNKNVKFLIWGDGTEREQLQELCKKMELDNIIFKGKIEKKYIPYILSKADLNLLHWKETKLQRYGCSSNKLFDYLASGSLILSDLDLKYDLLKEKKCGIVTKAQTCDAFEESIQEILLMNDVDKEKICLNAIKTAEMYDYKNLTNKLEKILEKSLRRITK